MPPKRPRPPTDDNDFVVSDNNYKNDGEGDGDGDGGSARATSMAGGNRSSGRNRNKKARAGGKREEGGGDNGGVPGGGGRDGKGEEFWEISEKRRVNISAFNGKRMVNIREYYEKDGEALPGKKGISLTIQQFNALVALLPHIETVLADKGESITRPEYSAESGTGAGKEIAVAEGNEDEFVADAGEGKRNFEETSDEE